MKWSVIYIVNTELQEIEESKNEHLQMPWWNKYTLSVREAAVYFGIGETKIRQLLNERGCSFLLMIGNKHLVKRKEFEKYLDNEHYL